MSPALLAVLDYGRRLYCVLPSLLSSGDDEPRLILLMTNNTVDSLHYQIDKVKLRKTNRIKKKCSAKRYWF